MKRKIVFATNNLNKLEEVRRMLGDEFEVMSLDQIGFLDDIPETGQTLKENALQKASFISNKFDLDCFADDTGLMVNALKGEPGVYSARYAGEQRNSEDNMDLLLSNLANEDDRSAYFSTVICLMENKIPRYFEGQAHGNITHSKSGRKGFGYDPIFRPRGYEETFAELSQEQKNDISHRGKAIRSLVGYLNEA